MLYGALMTRLTMQEAPFLSLHTNQVDLINNRSGVLHRKSHSFVW
jgi:hypothetical protein